MIKLVASDLDGTLLRDGAQMPNPQVYDLIRRLREMGVLFVAASGRQFSVMRRMFAPIKDEIAYICENGAFVYADGKVLYQDTLDQGLAKEIMQAIWERKGAEMTISGIYTYYIRPKTEKFRSLLTDILKLNCKEVDDFEHFPEKIMKVAVHEKSEIDESYQYWSDRFSDRCVVVTSGFGWMDFIPFGTDKGKGIRFFQERMNLKPEECMAFGDEYNDIEMLQAVGRSYAMDTARPGVKKISRFITGNVEEELKGLIQELEKEGIYG